MAAILVPLAIWILLNGLDDLVLDVACVCRMVLRRISRALPTDAEIDAVPQRRMAIFVPLWKEHRVIQNMVEHNIATQRYQNYDFFIGAYPNDAPTLAAIKEVVRRFPNAHSAFCPHDGPTSKADNLNWIYQRMLLFEEETGAHFDMILTHDAEDLIHPDALRCINYYAESNDMVQIPVLALPTSWREFTHGAYCDDFAEFQFKDMPVRHLLGGFVPSNGVGTGFSRNAIEKLAAAHSNRIFEPECLTEDYENGFRIHKLRCPQIFVPIHKRNGTVLATREYFPRTFKSAVRQRTRWVMGIALQSWGRHGLRDTLPQAYWFWRDRKSLIGSLLTPLINLLSAYGAATWLWSAAAGTAWGLRAEIQPPWLMSIYQFTMGLQLIHIAMRARCSSRIYGWKFAAATPLRVIWGNWINFVATASAIYRFSDAKLHGRPLVWLKTEHAYPNRAALQVENRKKLGEVLVGSLYVTAEDLEAALQSQPPGVKIGQHLIALGKITEQDLYEALALQQNLPFGRLDEVSPPVTRAFPSEVSKRLKVVPFRVAAGQLYVASADVPSEGMSIELQQFCPLEIRFHLVTPADYDELSELYLTQPSALQELSAVSTP